MNKYETIIGLEVHAELKTKSKIYCDCKNSFGSDPNTNICPICMGMPGTLPSLNKKAVEYAIKMGHKLQKEECKIDWNKSAQEIHNLVRGVYKCPGAHFEYQNKIIKVLETEPLNENIEGKNGDFVRFSKSGIDVKTSNGTLRLIKIKPEGKGEMFASDWANGIKHHHSPASAAGGHAG